MDWLNKFQKLHPVEYYVAIKIHRENRCADIEKALGDVVYEKGGPKTVYTECLPLCKKRGGKYEKMIIFDDICTKKWEGDTGNECEGFL